MLAIQVFITYLEFYLVAALSLVLVPFGVFKHTAFMAERAFGSVVSFGVKLMVLSFIIAAAGPVLTQITLPAEPTWQQAYMVLLASMAIAFLAWHAPGIAAGMVSGGPSSVCGERRGICRVLSIRRLGGRPRPPPARPRTAAAGPSRRRRLRRAGLGRCARARNWARPRRNSAGPGPRGKPPRPRRGRSDGVRTEHGGGGLRGRSALPALPLRRLIKRGEVRAWKPQPPNPTGTTAERVLRIRQPDFKLRCAPPTRFAPSSRRKAPGARA